MADKETTRVEAFSDGVFAIAITLLILEIKVPELKGQVTSLELIYSLLTIWPSYFAFLFSFIAILIMWINHHHFFNYIRTIDSKFLFANGLLLLFVTFLPFPTSVLAKYLNTPAENAAAAFYCGTMVVIAISYNLLWFTSAYKRRLVKNDLSDSLIIKIRNAYWFGIGVYFSAFIISFFYSYIGLGINFALWIFWSLLDYQSAKRKKHIESPKELTRNGD